MDRVWNWLPSLPTPHKRARAPGAISQESNNVDGFCSLSTQSVNMPYAPSSASESQSSVYQSSQASEPLTPGHTASAAASVFSDHAAPVGPRGRGHPPAPAASQDHPLFGSAKSPDGRTVHIFGAEHKAEWKAWIDQQPWSRENSTNDTTTKAKMVQWGRSKVDPKWKEFDEGAWADTGKPCLICRRCGEILVHPALGSGNKGMAGHLDSRACQNRQKFRNRALGHKPGQTSIEDGFNKSKVRHLHEPLRPTHNAICNRRSLVGPLRAGGALASSASWILLLRM